MQDDPLIITLDEVHQTQEGVPADDLLSAVEGTKEAMQLLVRIMGQSTPLVSHDDPPPDWVLDQSKLRIVSAQSNSPFSVTVAHDFERSDEIGALNLGSQAFEALRDWNGTGGPSLPVPVIDVLSEAAQSLSPGINMWMGSEKNPRRNRYPKQTLAAEAVSTVAPRRADVEQAIVQGWLNEVNWKRHTAQLHGFREGVIQLRFPDALSDEMRELATEFVEVRGVGRFNAEDQWTSILVRQIQHAGNWKEHFDLDAFLSDPDPKFYEAGRVPPIELTDEEWEAYNQAMREGRSA